MPGKSRERDPDVLAALENDLLKKELFLQERRSLREGNASVAKEARGRGKAPLPVHGLRGIRDRDPQGCAATAARPPPRADWPGQHGN